MVRVLLQYLILATVSALAAACTPPEDASVTVLGEAQQAAYDPTPGPSRWEGIADIEAGETNTQTAAKAQQAANLIKSGEKFMLGHIYEPSMPLNPTAAYDLDLKPTAVFASQAFNGEVLTADIGQIGTQLDSLGHFGWLPPGATTEDEIVYYGGFTGAEVHGPDGLQHLGAERLKPFFTRAIFIDVKRYVFNNQTLPPGYEITSEDLLVALDAQKMDENDIEEGDVVLINTGWEEFWNAGPLVYYAGGPGVPGGTPGIGLDAAIFLADRRVACVGSDNWSVEVAGEGDREPPPPGIPFPVHHHLQVVSGISHQESMHLSELADALAASPLTQKTYTVAYVMIPLPIKGATGSPGIPMALR